MFIKLCILIVNSVVVVVVVVFGFFPLFLLFYFLFVALLLNLLYKNTQSSAVDVVACAAPGRGGRLEYFTT